MIKLLRPHQWVKNLLVFVPITLAHQLSSTESLISTVWAFIAFCFAASAIYIVNDIADAESDRHHPRKKTRPIAAREISVPKAMMIAMVMLAIAATVTTLFSPLEFAFWLIGYVAVTALYTFLLKRVVLVDVLTLAGLYTLRIAAGGAAADVEVSPWLLAFSLFIFTSLAFLKRYTELLDTVERDGIVVHGRGYHVGDAAFVFSIGPALGFIAVLVLTLYLNGSEVLQLYSRPIWLWLLVPLLIYWIARLWLAAHRGTMHDDPILYALKDRASYAVAILVAAVIMLARSA